MVQCKEYLVPIDVKKGRGTLNSLQHFANQNTYGIAVKFALAMPGYDPKQRLLTLPLYMVSFFAEEIQCGKVWNLL